MSLKKSDIATAAAAAEDLPFVLGETAIYSTISFNVLGRLTRVSRLGDHYFLHLEDASSITDVGRLGETLRSGKIPECDPVEGEVRVSVASLVDIYLWDHPLPRAKK